MAKGRNIRLPLVMLLLFEFTKKMTAMDEATSLLHIPMMIFYDCYDLHDQNFLRLR